MHDEDDTPGASGDSPLWAVDFVVPDDISELHAELAAYRREQRVQRRRRRLARLGLDAPVRRHLVVPLLALILLVAAVAGSLLVSLEPHSGPPVPERAPLSTTSVPVGKVGGLLPDVVAGTPTGPVRLRDLRPAVLALVPPGCHCVAVLDHLAGQADEAGISLVLVAPPNGAAQLSGLLAGMHVGAPVGVVDTSGTLTRYYRPQGVTALLLAPDGRVPFAPARRVSSRTDLQGQLFELVPTAGG